MADQITLDDVSKMKVADLKKALKDKGLAASGSKSELVERLTEALNTGETKGAETELIDAVLEDSRKVNDAKDPEPVTKIVAQVTDSSLSQDQQVAQSPEKTKLAPEPEPSEAAEERVPATKVVVSTSLSESEKIKKRAERFGLVNEDAKKQARAERFGIPASKTSTTASGGELDALKKRAERFGAVTATTLSKVDEAEKIKKRKDRFGDVTSEANNTPPKFAKITFNSTPSEDDKKKQRAARFGLS